MVSRKTEILVETNFISLVLYSLLLFWFVRSLRQSDFSLFTASFEAMLPWLAALDHSNNLRWGFIFLCDMHRPPTSVADELMKDHFAIKKTEWIFQPLELTKPMNKTTSQWKYMVDYWNSCQRARFVRVGSIWALHSQHGLRYRKYIEQESTWRQWLLWEKF